jgi:hypothetical protein
LNPFHSYPVKKIVGAIKTKKNCEKVVSLLKPILKCMLPGKMPLQGLGFRPILAQIFYIHV